MRRETTPHADLPPPGRRGRSILRLLAVAAATAVLALSMLTPLAANATPRDATATQGSVTLRWLGTAGWAIRVGGTAILLDPFITRNDVARDQEWRTDEAAVLNYVDQANYVFVTHSHKDHVADVPFIARRFGSRVIGSATTTNLALSVGVESSQITTIRGGERLEFDGFSVDVVESLHDLQEGATPGGAPRTIDRPLGRPIRGGDFAEGGTYLYSFTFGSKRLLAQGSGNFRMDRLAGLQPDVVLMVPTHDDYDLGTALATLNPRGVVAHHFDEWRGPYALGVTDRNLGRARRFGTEVRTTIPQIVYTIPQYFEDVPLDTLLTLPQRDAPAPVPQPVDESGPAPPEPVEVLEPR